MRRRNRPRASRGPLLIPALLVTLGITFLVLSVVPIYGSQPEVDEGHPHAFEALPEEQLIAANDIRPQKASAATTTAATASTASSAASADKPPGQAPTPVPVRRQAVPLDALPVTNARPVGGGTAIERAPVKPVQQVALDSGPLQVAIVSHLPDGQLVSQLKAGLESAGNLDVYETELASLGRPDVLLILDSSTTGSSVWFCGPTPNESSELAHAVLAQIGELPQEPDDAIGDAVDRSLGCSDVARRPRTHGRPRSPSAGR